MFVLCVWMVTGRSSHKAAMFPRWVPYAYQLPDLDDVHSLFSISAPPSIDARARSIRLWGDLGNEVMKPFQVTVPSLLAEQAYCGLRPP